MQRASRKASLNGSISAPQRCTFSYTGYRNYKSIETSGLASTNYRQKSLRTETYAMESFGRSVLVAEIDNASTHAAAKETTQAVSDVWAGRELEFSDVRRLIPAMLKLMKRQYIAHMHVTRRGSGRVVLAHCRSTSVSTLLSLSQYYSLHVCHRVHCRSLLLPCLDSELLCHDSMLVGCR